MAETSIAAPARAPRLRKRWWIVAALLTVLVVAAVVVVAVLRHLDAAYGPVSDGPLGGIGRDVVPRAGDGDGEYVLDTAGDGTGFVYASLDVEGTHTVRITSIDTDEVTVRAQWAPWPTDENVALPQKNAPWRDFPAVVGRGLLQLRYEIRRPQSCQGRPMRPDYGAFYEGTHTVHWESLLGDRSAVVGGGRISVQIC